MNRALEEMNVTVTVTFNINCGCATDGTLILDFQCRGHTLFVKDVHARQNLKWFARRLAIAELLHADDTIV